MHHNLILLVEDNPTDELLTVRAFKKNNIPLEIMVARDGVEALDFLFARGQYQAREGQPLPSIVLLDLKLPRLDGISVLRAIRQHEATRLLPVVVLTSSNEEHDLMECYQLGVNSYVRKPVDFGEFVRAAEQLGLYWLSLNQVPTGLQKRGTGS